MDVLLESFNDREIEVERRRKEDKKNQY